jgi:hypothetical protein
MRLPETKIREAIVHPERMEEFDKGWRQYQVCNMANRIVEEHRKEIVRQVQEELMADLYKFDKLDDELAVLYNSWSSRPHHVILPKLSSSPIEKVKIPGLPT